MILLAFAVDALEDAPPPPIFGVLGEAESSSESGTKENPPVDGLVEKGQFIRVFLLR